MADLPARNPERETARAYGEVVRNRNGAVRIGRRCRGLEEGLVGLELAEVMETDVGSEEGIHHYLGADFTR